MPNKREPSRENKSGKDLRLQISKNNERLLNRRRTPAQREAGEKLTALVQELHDSARKRFEVEETNEKQTRQEMLVHFARVGYDSAMLTVSRLQADKRKKEAELKSLKALIAIAKEGSRLALRVEEADRKGNHIEIEGFDDDGRIILFKW